MSMYEADPEADYEDYDEDDDSDQDDDGVLAVRLAQLERENGDCRKVPVGAKAGWIRSHPGGSLTVMEAAERLGISQGLDTVNRIIGGGFLVSMDVTMTPLDDSYRTTTPPRHTA